MDIAGPGCQLSVAKSCLRHRLCQLPGHEGVMIRDFSDVALGKHG